ncbi:MAG TPA: FAD-dependent oxidoreductase, partial [Patescibacteria group bacterium]|nr:FAD-dependent oxidoreductase [Patescibacteria group bacterium]
MEHGSGKTLSLWMDGVELQSRPVAGEDMTVDVCVVGAGISGLTVAYKLAREGKDVIVIDDGDIGGGETSRTTAHIVNALDERYFEIERLHGEKGARLAAESHTAAIAQIEQIVAEEGIDCDFTRLDGYLFCPPDQSPDILEKERAAAHRAGLTDLELVDNAPLREFLTGPALRFPQQAQFHAMKYLNGL